MSYDVVESPRSLKDTTGAQLTKVGVEPSENVTAGVAAAHKLLDGVANSDTLLGTVVAGDTIVGNATPKWSRLAIGASATLLTVSAGAVVWAAPVSQVAIVTQFSPANPTATASASFVLMGLGSTVTYTPVRSGKVKVTAVLTIANDTALDGASAELRFGTGSAPANGAADSGTKIGNSTAVYTNPAAAAPDSKTLIGYITGLTLSTAVWFDAALKRVTGGNAALTAITFLIEEL
jgi:hypothetical protein